ncbi:hypothetical protein EGW08_023306 [Elysia chlorotica]|uniref:Uncharacterized protein n=1 Tax=Elysia chlorotica TaxID=188477 RepID=A0A433SIV2_ELYCH|nr:hypothetical protein EGW08_023306 [Elysia chlorotica]
MHRKLRPSGKSAFISSKPIVGRSRPAPSLVTLDNFSLIAWPRAGDASFKCLPYQISMLQLRGNARRTGKRLVSHIRPAGTPSAAGRWPLPFFRGACLSVPRRPTVTARASARRVALSGSMSSRSPGGPPRSRVRLLRPGTLRAPVSSTGRDGLKRSLATLSPGDRPPCRRSRLAFFFNLAKLFTFCHRSRKRVRVHQTFTTLSGGSLGSCVDEERSQLRELM